MAQRSEFTSLVEGPVTLLTSIVFAPYSLDTPATYVDGLARLFVRAQVLDKHLQSLLRAQSSPTSSEMSEIKGMGSHVTGSYAILSPELRGNIEAKLKRSSDFFANVVLCFVLRDLGILIDK